MGMKDAKKRAEARTAAEVLTPKGGYAQDAQRPAPRATEGVVGLPKGWEHPGKPTWVDGRLDTITSAGFPAGSDREKSLQETLDAIHEAIPEGFEAILDDVEWKHNEAGWTRESETTQIDGVERKTPALTKPTSVVRFRWKIVPIKAKSAGLMSEEQWAEFVASAKKAAPLYAPTKRRKRKDDRAMCGILADPQTGQGDGDGTDGLIRRYAMLPGVFESEYRGLIARGVGFDKIVLPSLGDLIENVVGFYPAQNSMVSLDLTDQVRLASRLIRDFILAVCDLGLPVYVPVVPGNHGENRASGKVTTNPYDNFDLLVMHSVADVIEQTSVAKQVTFAFPEKRRLTLVQEYNDTLLGMHHGHLTGHGSGGATTKAKSWIDKMAGAGEPIGSCDVLVMGHLHHSIFTQLNRRMQFIQAPALCDESEHFLQHYGLGGGPGFTTFTLGGGYADHHRVQQLPHGRGVAALRVVA